MTEPVAMSGRHIHQAAHALVTLQNAALDRAGVTFTQWKVLDKASGIYRDDVIHHLADLTMNDPRTSPPPSTNYANEICSAQTGAPSCVPPGDWPCSSGSAPSGPVCTEGCTTASPRTTSRPPSEFLTRSPGEPRHYTPKHSMCVVGP
jgi:hypothetical protein